MIAVTAVIVIFLAIITIIYNLMYCDNIFSLNSDKPKYDMIQLDCFKMKEDMFLYLEESKCVKNISCNAVIKKCKNDKLRYLDKIIISGKFIYTNKTNVNMTDLNIDMILYDKFDKEINTYYVPRSTYTPSIIELFPDESVEIEYNYTTDLDSYLQRLLQTNVKSTLVLKCEGMCRVGSI